MKKIIKHRILSHELPFNWRTNNCIHSAAEVIDNYHGVDCIKQFGFTFADSRRENLALLRKRGYNDLIELFDKHFDEKDNLYANTGDLCICDDAWCVGVYQYDAATFWCENGLTRVPRKEIKVVYNLDSYKGQSSG